MGPPLPLPLPLLRGLGLPLLGLWRWLGLGLGLGLLLLTDGCRADMLDRYTQHNPRPAKMTLEEYEFDWIHYLDIYQDLAPMKSDAVSTWNHYHAFGKKEGRYGPRRFPAQPSLAQADARLTAFVQNLDARGVLRSDRTLVIYHVPALPDPTALDGLINTLKVFTNAVERDNSHKNFYWFNIVEGSGSILYRYLPPEAENVALLTWYGQPQETLVHLRTLDLLQGSATSQHFGSFFFGSTFQRGPLAQVDGGAWLEQYRGLLRDDVQLVGASFSCELVPHVQGVGLAINHTTIATALRPLASVYYRKWKTTVRFFAQFLSVNIMKHQRVASLLYLARDGQRSFEGKCLQSTGQGGTLNAFTWSDVNIADILFVPWNLREYGQLSVPIKRAVQASLQVLQLQQPQLALHVPDTVVGDYVHDLSVQYHQELLRDVDAQRAKYLVPAARAEGTARRDQVCLLVRSSFALSQHRNRSLIEEDYFSGIDNIVHSLRRQSDGNWVAYFFLVDDVPYETMLLEELTKYADPRLQLLAVPAEARPKYSRADDGYTATDAALQQALAFEHCGKIAVTDMDNMYGSDVVHSVRAVNTSGPFDPKLVLAPLDSRLFLYQDLLQRSPSGLGQGSVCGGLLSLLDVHTWGLIVQPKPLRRVDLSAVFFDRTMLLQERVAFNNFSHSASPAKYPCVGCQDGYFIFHFVTTQHQKYVQLGIGGLQSVVYKGPAPTWCVASGLTWFAHPRQERSRCFSHSTVRRLKALDRDTAAKAKDLLFDWDFLAHNNRRCLQLTKAGLLRYP